MALKDTLVKLGMWPAVAAALTESPTFTTPNIGAATGTTLTLTGGVRMAVTTVAAAGSSQSDAAALSEGFNFVTGPDDTKGVKLPAAEAGKTVIIKVGDGADLKVYPATGDAINALSANAALTVVDDVCFMLVALDSTTWYTLPLLPS